MRCPLRRPVFAQLARWHRPMREALTAFSVLVEVLVGWPACPAHLVALLLGGGTHGPMGRQPIVLLPVVYPLRAVSCAALMRDWLRKAGVLRVHSVAAADLLAGLLGRQGRR